MLGHNFGSNAKVVLAKAGQTAATSDVTSDAIDTHGYAGVAFFGTVATAAANNKVHAEQSDASGSGFADLAGTSISPGDNGDAFLVDIYQPREKWVRVVLERGTSTASGDIYAILYGPIRDHGAASHGTTIDAELHVAPAEGTP